MSGADDSLAVSATSYSLLAKARAADEKAWERVVELYAPLVYGCIRRAGLPSEAAEDVFQEVFLSAAQNLATFEKRGEADSFRGWLFTIARNKTTDHFRRLQNRPRAVGGSEAAERFAEVPAAPQESESPSELSSGAAQRRQLFARALEQARPSFRDSTWLAFYRSTVENRTAADVGEELGMSAGAVRVAKSRVLQKLRAEFGDLLR